MISPRQKTNRTVPGCVHEKRSRETGYLTSPYIKGMNCGYFTAFLINFKGVMIELKIDILFGPYDLFLLGILKFLIGARRLFGMVANFFDDFSNARIFPPANISFCPYANLTRSVSTQNRSVLY